MTVLLDLVDYTKVVSYSTIKSLAARNEIDTVYVRFADEDNDRLYDCMKPTDMKHLHDIIKSFDSCVIGWRLHHHHREERNLAIAKSIMEREE